MSWLTYFFSSVDINKWAWIFGNILNKSIATH